MQTAEVVAPTILLAVPLLQSEHAEINSLPTALLYVPARQKVQDVAPDPLIHWPAAHNVQVEDAVAPIAVEKEPATHGVQNAAPLALQVPATHLVVHVVLAFAPIALLYDPGAQGVHVSIDIADVALLHVPTPQEVQYDAPFVLHIPLGHGLDVF